VCVYTYLGRERQREKETKRGKENEQERERASERERNRERDRKRHKRTHKSMFSVYAVTKGEHATERKPRMRVCVGYTEGH